MDRSDGRNRRFDRRDDRRDGRGDRDRRDRDHEYGSSRRSDSNARGSRGESRDSSMGDKRDRDRGRGREGDFEDSSRRRGVSNRPAWMDAQEQQNKRNKNDDDLSDMASSSSSVIVEPVEPTWALGSADVLISKKWLGEQEYLELKEKFKQKAMSAEAEVQNGLQVDDEGPDDGGKEKDVMDALVSYAQKRRDSLGGGANGDYAASLSSDDEEKDGDDGADDMDRGAPMDTSTGAATEEEEEEEEDLGDLGEMDDLYGDLTGDDEGEGDDEAVGADQDATSEGAALVGGEKSEYAGLQDRDAGVDGGDGDTSAGTFLGATVPYAMQNLSTRRLHLFSKSQRGYDFAALYSERLADFQGQI